MNNDYHGHVRPNSDGSKARCGGYPSCATCRQEMKDLEIEAANEKFDSESWTFTAVHNETGVETVLYGKARHNVIIFALAKADAENSWLKVTKYVDPNPFKCYYSRCEGHPNEWNECSATRMYEDMTRL